LARGDIPDVAFCGLSNLLVLKTIRRLADGTTSLVAFGRHPDQVDPADLAAVAELLRPVVGEVEVLAAAITTGRPTRTRVAPGSPTMRPPPPRRSRRSRCRTGGSCPPGVT
jgi:hypothetical protein